MNFTFGIITGGNDGLVNLVIDSIENQKITLQQSLSEETYRKIEWVTEIPDKFTGVVFMNEFIAIFLEVGFLRAITCRLRRAKIAVNQLLLGTI